MLISNFNLCKDEWLELVFAKRNKEYGAYYIRQHHSEIVFRSFIIGVFGVAVIVGLIGIAIRTKPVTEVMVVAKLDQIYVIPPAPKAQPPKPIVQAPKAAAAPAAPTTTVRFVPPVVTADPIAEEPPKLDELKAANVGAENVKGTGTAINTGDGTDKASTGTGAGVGTGDDDVNTPYTAVEMMPQPVGGDAAWSRFLQSNIHYPDKAMQDGVSGRVLVSFIVEKDGHLSNIKVERGPGYGLDEEAARVLKIAKAWKPGMQNGRAVRVKLTLPVSFTIND
ncbi:energy transducer TonB [Mucilaginibacter sp. dw_454]|uniref:energy transducer TonB n=1 Tax=Mucilaginibacter sp. dw_454 TaxID=2720079 RepID=UPI001BD1C030|nr:energy transducer TonB [Mucilaginibacter sp. dw_454]